MLLIKQNAENVRTKKKDGILRHLKNVMRRKEIRHACDVRMAIFKFSKRDYLTILKF